jgi:Tfp pilus assembly pilus retraction ATPase PilT
MNEIPSMIQTGKKGGMQLLDQHILEYLMSGAISAEEAYMKCNNKAASSSTSTRHPQKSSFDSLTHIGVIATHAV